MEDERPWDKALVHYLGKHMPKAAGLRHDQLQRPDWICSDAAKDELKRIEKESAVDG